MPSNHWGTVLAKSLGLAIVYALLARLVLTVSTANGNVTIFWIPGGLALAALLVWGWRFWPAVFAGAVAAGLMVDDPFLTSLFLASGNTLETLFACWLLHNRLRFDAEMGHPHDFFSLTLAGTFASAISALIGPVALYFSDYLTLEALPHNISHWWQADVLGILLGAPLFLTWRKLPKTWLNPHRLSEILLFFLLAFLLGQAIFLDWFYEWHQGVVKGYWMFLFVTVAALRCGLHGVLLLTAMVAIQSLSGAVLGVGYFGNDIAQTGLIGFWFYLMMLTVTGLALTLTLRARQRVDTSLRETHERLQQALTASRAGTWLVDLATNMDTRDAHLNAMLGYAAVPSTQPNDDWFRHIPADVQPAMKASFERALQTGVYEVEHPLIRADGQTIWVYDRGMVLKDEAGHASSVVGTVIDITALKQTEATLRESEARFRELASIVPVVIYQTDAQGKCIFVNDTWQRITGCSPESTLGYGWLEKIHPEDQERVLREWHLAMDSGQAFSCEYRILCADGAAKDTLGHAIAYHDQDGELVGYVGTLVDITERKRAEESLRLAQQVYQHSSESMVLTEADGTIVSVNPAFSRVTGYTAEEALGQNPRMLSSGKHDKAFFRDLWDSLETTGAWEGEIWNRRKNGELYIAHLFINTVYRDDGISWRRVGLFTDITQQKINEERLWKQANLDPLTGLPNRRMFLDRLAQEIKKSQRAGLPLVLLFLDMDCFKEVNDTLGHETGDELLKEAAIRLAECVRETDTVARLGGDEFTVILGAMENPETLDRITRTILERLSQPYALGNETAYVSVSIGITLYPEDATEIEPLLKNADQAMYAAKAQGRNRASYFTPALQKAAEHRLRLANDLRLALSQQQLEVHYQPIVELQTGSIHKAEALIRWKHPEKGYIPPNQFIPIAEDTGLIHDIGDWVFRVALNQVKNWRKTLHPHFQISINKSPIQFRDGIVCHTGWCDSLSQEGLPGESIVVEITEGLLLEAEEPTLLKLLQFRDAGIQVAIDDFGIGYSALSYLKKFDIDYLKIDQSFTQSLAPGSSDLALCEAIVVMAQKLSLKVIAEGVETEAQRDLLKAIGCDYGQGYLFAKPLSAEQFEDFWRLHT